MITASFLKEKLKEYQELSGHLVKNTMVYALVKIFNCKYPNVSDYRVGISIDRITESGERVSYSTILKNLPRPKQKENEFKMDFDMLKFQRGETREKCFREGVLEYQCNGCSLDYCSLITKAGASVVKRLSQHTISLSQAKREMAKFKGYQWFEDAEVRARRLALN